MEVATVYYQINTSVTLPHSRCVDCGRIEFYSNVIFRGSITELRQFFASSALNIMLSYRLSINHSLNASFSITLTIYHSRACWKMNNLWNSAWPSQEQLNFFHCKHSDKKLSTNALEISVISIAHTSIKPLKATTNPKWKRLSRKTCQKSNVSAMTIYFEKFFSSCPQRLLQ